MSIGLPVFNGMPDLPKALESLLAQDYPALEIIVSDNASTDGTWEYIQGYAADPRVVLVRNNSNLGAVGNFRRVLELARGEYFMWAAHDDTRSPDCVRLLVEELEAHPEATIALGAIQTFRHDGVSGAPEWRFPKVNDMTPLRAAWSLWFSGKYNYFVYGLMRTAVLRRAGALPEGASFRTDRILVAEMALAGKLRYVDELVYYRKIEPSKYKAADRSRLARWRREFAFFRLIVASMFRSPIVPAARKPLVLIMIASQLCRKVVIDATVRPLGRWWKSLRGVLPRAFSLSSHKPLKALPSARKSLTDGQEEKCLEVKKETARVPKP